MVFGLCFVGLSTWAATGSDASELADTLCQSVATPPIADVVLHHGTLQGRVVSFPGHPAGSPDSPLGVSVLRETQVVGATTTDHQGRFTVEGLRTGLYRLVVNTPGGPRSVLFRAWLPRQAPPHAAGAVNILLYPPTVRGQVPLPTTSFPQAVAIGAVAGGAIAAPIIYNNAKKQNQIPASP